MMRNLIKIGICAGLITIMVTGSAWAWGWFSFTSAPDTTSCKTKYPIIMAHGMAFEPSATYPNSFPGNSLLG